MPRPSNAARAQRTAAVFAALGDPTRLSLVDRLASHGPESISGLSATAKVTRQAVTKHLVVLEEAGLVHSFREGRSRIWELEAKQLDEARSAIDRISAQWDEALLRLKDFVEDDS